MDVLEDSLGVAGHLEPQILGDARVPGLREVGELEPVLEDLELELEPQHDVQVVGDLVGLDPDQRRLDLVRRPVERLRVDPRELLREELLEPRMEVGQVRAPPAHPAWPWWSRR